MPVTVGFTSAAAITIASSQLKGLFGLKGSTDKFMDSIVNFFKRIHEAELWDSVLGLSTIAALLILNVINDGTYYFNNHKNLDYVFSLVFMFLLSAETVNF